jgi:hypothetical protein
MPSRDLELFVFAATIALAPSVHGKALAKAAWALAEELASEGAARAKPAADEPGLIDEDPENDAGEEAAYAYGVEDGRKALLAEQAKAADEAKKQAQTPQKS